MMEASELHSQAACGGWGVEKSTTRINRETKASLVFNFLEELALVALTALGLHAEFLNQISLNAHP